MFCIADFISKIYNNVNHLFRINTKLVSIDGEGEVIGLVYMLNPGSLRPLEKSAKKQLENFESEYSNVNTTIDPTLASVIRLLKYGAQKEKLNISGKYTIHIENLFNICDKKDEQYDAFEAFKTLNEIEGFSSFVNYNRKLDNYKYQFVWLAWGNIDLFKEKRERIMRNYPNSIQIKKRNHKGKIIKIDYPHHPLYLNENLFEEFIKR